MLHIPNRFPSYSRNNSQSSTLNCTSKRSANRLVLFKTSLNTVGQIGNVASTRPLEICGRTSDAIAKPCTHQKAQEEWQEKVAGKLKSYLCFSNLLWQQFQSLLGNCSEMTVCCWAGGVLSPDKNLSMPVSTGTFKLPGTLVSIMVSLKQSILSAFTDVKVLLCRSC